MVLNMADFDKSRKSVQTLWTAFKTVVKWFATASANVCVDLWGIPKGRKLADFEQKAWAIAHVFEHGRFGKSWKSLHTLGNASKTVLKWFVTDCATLCVDLGWIRKCRKLADFEQRAIAHGFEHGRFRDILEIHANTLKRIQHRSKMICDFFRDCLCRFRVNSQISKIGRFWAKGLGHGFEHGRLWQVLEIAPNSLKRLQNRSKMICDCLRDCLCRSNVNSQVSKIGRFWTKAL